MYFEKLTRSLRKHKDKKSNSLISSENENKRVTSIYLEYDHLDAFINKDYKIQYLNMIDAELLYQRFAIRLSYSKKYISPNNYKTWSVKVAEIGKMLGGWIKSCQNA